MKKGIQTREQILKTIGVIPEEDTEKIDAVTGILGGILFFLLFWALFWLLT